MYCTDEKTGLSCADPCGTLMISNAEYHADPAVSASHLHAVLQSPQHYFKKYIDPNRPKNEPTAAMRLGTLGHTAVLEPDELKKRHPVVSSRRTKEAQQLINDGFEPVLQSEMDTAEQMAESVRNHPEAAWLLSVGEAEQSLWWNDDEHGLRCKCRPDWWSGDLVVDLKTTQDASPKAFAKSVANFGYHRQQAHYVKGTKCARFIFIVVEKTYPFQTAVYELDTEASAIGEDQRRRAMNRIATCKQRDEWPGYGDNVQTLSLPSWATYDEIPFSEF